MSYRSIKRVLGETSLERKCRLLFGGCLLLLITIAFWGVDRIAGRLVMKNTRNHGHDLVDIIMIKVHTLLFETDNDVAAESDPQQRGKTRHVARDHRGLRRDADLSLRDRDAGPRLLAQVRRGQLVSPAKPQDEVERQLLVELDRLVREQKGPDDPAMRRCRSENLTPEEALGDVEERVVRPVYVDRLPDRAQGEYHYFEPVHFNATCRVCHMTAADVGAVSATELGHSSAQDPPLLP